MDKEKKFKLIYSGELMLFVVVFLTLGTLILLKVITLSENFPMIFKIVTLIGATWLTGDFVWAMLDKKRKERSSILDKAMLLPLAAYLYTFDIYGFAANPNGGYYQIGVPIAFYYIACAYLFQSIYHYYVPIPAMLEDLKEEEIQDSPEVIDQPVEEENKDLDEKKED